MPRKSSLSMDVPEGYSYKNDSISSTRTAKGVYRLPLVAARVPILLLRVAIVMFVL